MRFQGFQPKLYYGGLKVEIVPDFDKRVSYEIKRIKAMSVFASHQNKNFGNEAWVILKLTNTPISIFKHCRFNLFALMDAQSRSILNTIAVPLPYSEPSKLVAKQSLDKGKKRKQMLPKRLFIPNHLTFGILASEAIRQGIIVERIPEERLMHFIGKTRDGFKES